MLNTHQSELPRCDQPAVAESAPAALPLKVLPGWIPLQAGDELEQDAVYFPLDCVIAHAAVFEDARVAINCVGAGQAALPHLDIGTERIPLRRRVLVGGRAVRVAAGQALPDALVPLIGASMFQIVSDALSWAAAYRSLPIERCVARWLVMLFEAVRGEEIVITHETLATSLNCRRPGVTDALSMLEYRGFIRTSRGRVRLRNGPGLAGFAKGETTPFSGVRQNADNPAAVRGIVPR